MMTGAFFGRSYFGRPYFGPQTVVIARRGDDGGGREGFWRRKAEEWLEARLEALQKALDGPERERKRVATRIVGEIPDFVSEIPAFAPRVAALERLAERLEAPKPDYSALADAIERELAIIAEWRKRERRRRDIEALLVLAA